MNSYTVTELNDVIKKLITTEFKSKLINIVGEISNVKSSGSHTYLTLKDDNTSVSVAFFGKILDNKHGDHVEISATVDYYSKTGNVNLKGKDIKIIGVGNLHTQYEKIRDEYQKKGYFDNKLPLPSSVKNVGIVTAENSAALQDFISQLRTNNFSGNLYIYDCIVQGPNCPASVASGIKFFNSPFYPSISSYVNDSDNSNDSNNSDNSSDSNTNTDSDEDPFKITTTNNNNTKKSKKIDSNNNIDTDTELQIEVDIIVVARGGGSFEDLIGFSHPKVIEAIYASKKYIISAVGHEVDTMLSDCVANYRAPTPSIAGEVIVSINNNNRKKLKELESKIQKVKNDILQTLNKYRRSIEKTSNLISDPTEVLDKELNKLIKIAKNHITDKIVDYQSKIDEIKEHIDSNNPENILKHGFIVLTDTNGDIVFDIDNILNKNITMIHSSGNYDVVISKSENKLESKNKSESKSIINKQPKQKLK